MSDPRNLQKRLQTQEKTPRKDRDTSCIIVFDLYYGTVFSESLLGFGASSGELRDVMSRSVIGERRGLPRRLSRGSFEELRPLALFCRGDFPETEGAPEMCLQQNKQTTTKKRRLSDPPEHKGGRSKTPTPLLHNPI